MYCPKISIIIPIYNAALYLERCINSVLAQTFTEWELILVDDGSTDSSGVICDEYACRDSRIRVIHMANSGVSSARNTGLDNANGEWIVFCDSDDQMDSNSFMTISRFFRSDVDAVKTGYQIVSNTGLVLKQFSVGKVLEVEEKEDMLKYCEISHYCGFLWNTCIRASLIGNNRFNEDISWLEDHIFIYEQFQRCRKIVLLPNITYYYRTDINETTNLSSKIHNPHKLLYASQLERDAKYALLKDNQTLKKIIDKSYEEKIEKVVVAAFYTGDIRFAFFALNNNSKAPFMCLLHSLVKFIKGQT